MKLTTLAPTAILLCACCASLAGQNYTFTNAECNGNAIYAYGIDGAGVIVGNTAQAGAIYYNGTCQTYTSGFFYGVSDPGWLIVGIAFGKPYYLVKPGAKPTPLPNYPGAQATSYCCIVSAANMVAGNYYSFVGSPPIGFFYQNGKFTSLPWSDASGSPSYAYTLAALNRSGVAVGTFQRNYVLGFVLDRGKMSLLAYPGATYTYFYGVNDNGVVVGSYNQTRTGDTNVILYNIASGTWTNLNFTYPYDLLTPLSISNSGVIALGGPSAGVILATPTP